MSKGVDDSGKSLKKKFLITVAISAVYVAIAMIGLPPLPSRVYLEAGFMIWVIGTFGATLSELYKVVEIEKMEGFSRILLEFFIWGFSLTFSGLMTTFFAMMIDILDIGSNFKDVTNFYVQISLNFLLGGITLVGASLPLLPSLVKQRKRRAEPTPQSGGGKEDGAGKGT